MPLSYSQASRLKSIIRDLETAKDHPSPFVRNAIEHFSKNEIATAVRRIEIIIAAGDGYVGHKIIGAWHERGVLTVLDLFRRWKPLAEGVERVDVSKPAP